MAFNIWERWPWTSFQNLNLDWLMKAMKQAVTTAAEAVTTAEEAAESVGQFDDRITNNTNAIEALAITVNNIKEPYRVYVQSDLTAYHDGDPVQGTDVYTALHEGQLPYVEYNGELYHLEHWNYGNLWFFNVHVYENVDEVILRRIHIYPESSEVAYSIVNMAGGSSGNVFAVVVRYQNGGYVSDHTYAEILSQMQSGRIPVLLVIDGNNSIFEVCGLAGTDTATINGQSVACLRFADPSFMISNDNNVSIYTITANNDISHEASRKHMATLDDIVTFVNDGVETNALLKTAQTLTAAEQAQVKQNLNITEGGSAAGAVRYDTAQTLTDQQKAQARDNIGADSKPLILNVTESNEVYSVDKTAAEIRANMHNLLLTFGLNEGVTIDSYQIYGSPPYHYIVFSVADPETSSVTYIEYTVQVYWAGQAPTEQDDVPTVTHRVIQHNIGGGSLPDNTNAAAGDILKLDSNKNAVWADGNKPRLVIASDSPAIPPLSPNTLYVFTGDATTLSITLAAPANNNVVNEYHFIFNSGSTPTTLSLPNTIRQPDGFTVESNHVYEVSILENNMTAQGWAVTV